MMLDSTWMMSMVAMARPAPFTRHPMLPSSCRDKLEFIVQNQNATM